MEMHRATLDEKIKEMKERAERLIEAGKYNAGVVEVRDDLVVLAGAGYGGDAVALFGVEKSNIGYNIVNYGDEPDYL